MIATGNHQLISGLENLAIRDLSDTKWTGTKVRQAFIDFFQENGHTFVSSSPVIPFDDATLLFSNAGMNQFKSIFLGTVDKNSRYGQLKRAVNSQKCIRAGGKHNDLDDVGRDSYHHTMFEMLGNWSFGDYFKKEAIDFAWRLLTQVYGIQKDRLYVTYFGGCTKLDLGPDLEAKKIWQDIGVAQDHIIPGDVKDNFWEMGEVGPCGPCSEIHYDRIGERNASCFVNMDDPNVLEVWNIVFVQYNREKGGILKPLPANHIDTGMGLERMVSILQNKSSNYDTDIFTILFDKIQELTGANPYSGQFGDSNEAHVDTAYRIVADHLRTLCFAIADGCVPNNDGRGYVLRRVLRRGARFARKYLSVQIGSFFSKLAPTLVQQMEDVYPELRKALPRIKELLDEEETSFSITIDKGEAVLEKYALETETRDEKILRGTDIWRLYETFGFPIDLTKVICEEKGLDMDEEGFFIAQERSKQVSKLAYASKKKTVETTKLDAYDIDHLENTIGIAKSIDDFKYTETAIDAQIQAIYCNHQYHQTSLNIEPGQIFGLILDRTNFYAESGGQESDQGVIKSNSSAFQVLDTQNYAGYILHIGHMSNGFLELNQKVRVEYNRIDRRLPIMNNHTSTHILNFALREVLGDGVEQRGSLVAAEKLRFDFSHRSPLSSNEIAKIEDICNEMIVQSMRVDCKEVELAIARKIPGLRAVFGEVYPDPVRVVSIGANIVEILADLQNYKWRNYSIEFCGGTHVETTDQIKFLYIVEESGIAKGIRRIVAITERSAKDAYKLVQKWFGLIKELELMPSNTEKKNLTKSYSFELAQLQIPLSSKVKLLEMHTKIVKNIAEQEKQKINLETKKAIQYVKDYFTATDAKYMVSRLPEISASAKILSGVIQYCKTNLQDKPVYFFACDDKVVHANYVSLNKFSFTAQEWAEVCVSKLAGKCGGKPDSFQGQSENCVMVEKAIDISRNFVERLIDKSTPKKVSQDISSRN